MPPIQSPSSSVAGAEAGVERRAHFGPFVLDRTELTLRRDGQEVDLPERSLRLLAVLIDATGKTVSKDRLVEQVWRGTWVTDTSITEAMSRLRGALGDDARRPRYVRTVHGLGYRFIAPVEVRAGRQSIRSSGRAAWWRLSLAASVTLAGAVWIGGLAIAGLAIVGLAGVSRSAKAPVEPGQSRFRLAEYGVHGAKIREYEVPALPINDFSVTRAGGVLRRITHGGSYSDPVWTPDGLAVAMAKRRGNSFDLVLQEVDQRGPAQVLLEAPWDQYPEAWSRDGRSLIYAEDHPATGYDLWILRQGGDGTWRRSPLVRTAEHEAFAAISPDDRQVAFASRIDRRSEIFVLDLIGDGAAVRVSDAGGVFPFWSRAGDRLHYVEGERVLTLEADQIGRDVSRIARTATAVPGLRIAASGSAANSFVVATVD